MKKVVSLIDLKVMKTQNDCEIACDCVKNANVVLHVGLCREIFSRKHTATHKPTSAQPLIVTTMTYTHKIACRCGAPQASYDRPRHRNCFQTGPAQAFPKK